MGDSTITWPQPYVIVMMSSQHILDARGLAAKERRWALTLSVEKKDGSEVGGCGLHHHHHYCLLSTVYGVDRRESSQAPSHLDRLEFFYVGSTDSCAQRGNAGNAGNAGSRRVGG